ncbi:MXAN_6577-like cysteine-rich protein [Stigmatella hybrida]|uniref:MXAN_6577-like cysteine-rich protein n=1 Tax=Stigmatella hybrida TaxID=394097 RepID=UPI001CDB2ED7|nr:MXAN_6577-like cysteine-rich protein [Stigmatella hybrida]
MNGHEAMERRRPRRWALVAVLAGVLAGCPDQGAECGEGLSLCGSECVDLTSEPNHCGACGVTCGRAGVCTASACECGPGATRCGGQCVLTASDAAHCGGCGVACAAGQVCEAGQCQAACTGATTTRCGDGCVDLQADPYYCGTCDTSCGGVKSCRTGVCTYDVVAACFNTGQVVGLQAGTDLKGPNVAVGERPQTVTRMQDVLLVLDAAKRLREARLSDYGPLAEAPETGNAPNQVLVDEPFVYVINSTSNTLLVLRRRAEPLAQPQGGTRFPNGLGLTPVASVDFGANTNPYAMAKLGTDLWVTLYGNLGGDVSAGGRLARVNVANPLAPVLDPNPLVLPAEAFPGGSAESTPTGIAVHQGSLYIALNNLDPATYRPGGPGSLAKVNPRTRQVSPVPLGDGCLNAGWVASLGDRLLVSCGGHAVYDNDFHLTAVEKTGLVLLDAQDAVVSTYTLACPPGATDCPLSSAGRFAVVGSRAYVGDNNAGRVFVIEAVGHQLIERRGPGPGAQPPILACPSNGFSLVGDVVALP